MCGRSGKGSEHQQKEHRDLSTNPAKGTLLDLLSGLGSWFQIAETETQQNWIQKAVEKMISGC